MVIFVPDNLKTEKICKNAAKKLPFETRHLHDQYKTKKICDKALLENGVTLKSVSNCYKNQEICNKAVYNHNHNHFIPIIIRFKKCAIKPLILLTLLILVLLCSVLFLINVNSKECVIKLFLKILLC